MLRLALRLQVGGGRAGLLRQLLVTGGIALGVVAACLVAVLPGVLSHRADIMNGRSPHPVAEPARARFTFVESVDVFDGRRLGRVFVADVAAEAPPSVPGAGRLPGPGEVIASPALARLVRDGGIPAALVPGKLAGQVGPAALIEPDELFAYIGVAPGDLADGHAADRFGNRDDLALRRQQDGLAQSLALLVLPPVVAYLLVCGRLAAATRTRRYAALRLLGLRRGAVLRLAFLETALAGLVGAGLGVAAFSAVHPSVAGSGLLGFSWFAGPAAFGPWTIAALVIVTGLGAGLVAAAGVRRSLDRPLAARADATEPKARPWLLLPVLFGLGAAAYLLSVAPPKVPGSGRVGMGGTTAWIGIGAVVLLVVGVLIGLRPIVVGGARLLTVPRLPLAVRLAGARLALQSAGTLRLLGGLAMLVLVAGVSSGVLRDMDLRSSPRDVTYSVDIEGATVPDAAARQAIHDLPAAYRWTVQPSILDEEAFGSAGSGVVGQARAAGLRLVTMPCAGLRELVGRELTGCRSGGLYRLVGDGLAGTAFEVPAGTTFRYARSGTATTEVTVPRERLLVPDDSPFPIAAYGALFLAKDGPAFGWTSDSTSSFLIDPDPTRLSAFKAAVASISPATRVQVWGEDLDLLEQSRNQRGVIGFGVVAGFFVAVLAFGVAAVDNAVERRRDVAALLVLGVRRRTVRAIQIWQLLAALLVVLAAAGAGGYLAGNLAFRLNDVHRDWFAGPLEAMVPCVVAAVVVAVAAGCFVSVRRLRAEDFARE